MANKMLIDATHPEETRVVVVRGNRVEEFDFESASRRQLRGNIYLAKVTRVEPSLQAAFVEYGGNRHGFLAFSEIHPDYYQILTLNPLLYPNTFKIYDSSIFRLNLLTNPYNINKSPNLQFNLLMPQNPGIKLSTATNYGISSLWNHFFDPKSVGYLNSIYHYTGLADSYNGIKIPQKSPTPSNTSSTTSSRQRIDDWAYKGSGSSSSQKSAARP